ncbi:MAG: hydroxymethylbilane synthase [Thermoleophilia bacterium]|nr:hydroxymethylbilane synthase [Thermoleophilia bacterium]
MRNPSVKSITLGTRGSELALFQANQVARSIQSKFVGLSVNIKKITTSGDRILDSPLARIGDKGLFVKEIENELLDGAIDIAVHSGKDMPTELPDGLELAAYGPREDPRDAFIGKARGLDEIPAGGKVGTSSLRRRSQLLSLRPDLEIVDIRGNVDTRIRKIEEMGLSGTILAAAGIRRLGRESEAGFYFSDSDMIPAVGQGVIVIEARTGDRAILDLLERENHPESAAAVMAERALMKELEGGCQVPIGGHALITGGRLTMHAYLGSLDGSRFVRDSIDGSWEKAAELGQALARRMYATGGSEILAQVRGEEEQGRVDPVNHP